MFIHLFIFLDSSAKSPRKSPYKPSVVTSSFYGKQKPVYLTPLERKAIKESLPTPPSPSPPHSPPSQEKKKMNKKNGTGGRKVTAGSKNAEKKKKKKMGIQHYTTSVKAIKLSKLNSRFVYKEVSVSQSCFVGCLQLSEKGLEFIGHPVCLHFS